MPHTPSAWKRLRKSKKRQQRNRIKAKKIKVQCKTVATVIKKGDATEIVAEFKITQNVLDRAATKGYIHPNKAA